MHAICSKYYINANEMPSSYKIQAKIKPLTGHVTNKIKIKSLILENSESNDETKYKETKYRNQLNIFKKNLQYNSIDILGLAEINDVAFNIFINTLFILRMNIKFPEKLIDSHLKNQIMIEAIIIINLNIEDEDKQIFIFMQNNFWDLN